MDPFLELPIPLMVDILKYIPDFTTLQLFLRSSRAANAIFSEHAFEVVDAVAASALDLKLPQHLFTLFAIYGNHTACQSVDDFVRNHLYSHASAQHIREFYRARRRTHGEVDAQLVRRVLNGAANIERLTVRVGHELLSRVSEVRPMELENRESLYGKDFEPRGNGPNELHYASPELSWPLIKCPPPPAYPLRISHGARELPLSWIEAFRIQNSLWTVYVLLEAKRCLPSLAGWPPEREGEEDAQGLDLYWLLKNLFNRFAEWNVIDIGRCVLDIGPDIDNAPTPWPHPRPLSAPTVAHNSLPPKEFSAVSLMRLPRMALTPTPPGFWPRQPRGEQADLWQQSAESLREGAYSTNRLICWGLRDFVNNRGELSNATDMILYTPRLIEWFGLRIWDLERLFRLRLAPHPDVSPDEIGVPRYPGRPGEHMLFTWWSILFPME